MTIVKIVLRLKRTIVPSVLIRMRRYLGCAVIYEKKHGITNAKGKEAIQYFVSCIFHCSIFFSLDFPKNDFLSGVFLQCFHYV